MPFLQPNQQCQSTERRRLFTIKLTESSCDNSLDDRKKNNGKPTNLAAVREVCLAEAAQTAVAGSHPCAAVSILAAEPARHGVPAVRHPPPVYNFPDELEAQVPDRSAASAVLVSAAADYSARAVAAPGS